MTQVRLLPSPYKEAEEANRGYMQRLAEERLVRNFLLNAGLRCSAVPLNGWEQDTPSLGTIDPKTGVTQYYLSLTAGAWKAI